MKKIIAFFAVFLLPSAVAAAAPAAMPEKGVERIKWAAQCCGAAPTRIVVALVLLAVCIAAAVIFGKRSSGGDSDAE